MITEGYIEILKCLTCSREFPEFVFVADTDMPTIGMRSLTAVQSNDIIIFHTGPHESILQWEEHISRDIGERCRHVPLIRIKKNYIPKKCSFQEFQKKYIPSTLYYRCIHCGEEATPILKQSKEAFTQKHKIWLYRDGKRQTEK